MNIEKTHFASMSRITDAQIVEKSLGVSRILMLYPYSNA